MKTKSLILILAIAPVMVQAQVNYAGGDVTSSPNAAGDIVISNTYDGYPVTGIEVEAFFRDPYLTSVTIGTNVTSIGNYAFEECDGLTNVTILGSVTSFGDYAFYNCERLTSVTIGNGVTSIGNGAFVECEGLTSVTIGTNVTSIGPNAFDGCSLTNVTIPDSVTSIGEGAFEYCSLTSVTIPNSVTSIWYDAFAYNSLTNIAVAADNPAYSSVNGVLFDKTQATLIQFPTGLGGSYAISNSVTSIGDDAFAQCLSLTNVTIPNSVTSIGDYAFGLCPSLTAAYFQGNAPPDNGTVFSGDGATVYYYYGTRGWSSTYSGLPTVMLGAPAPQISGGIGIQSGQLGFTLTGVTNQTVMVEASTNLVNWQPVWTNMLSGAFTNFTDAQWRNYPSRFYRVSSP